MGLLLLCTKGELKCFLQSAADDSEAKSNELTGAVEELHKLLKEAGEGKGGEETLMLWKMGGLCSWKEFHWAFGVMEISVPL